MRCCEACRRGLKAGQQEDVLLAVGLRSLDALGLLRSVAGNRQEDDIVGPGTLDQRADFAQDVRPVGLGVDQGSHIADAHPLRLDSMIAGIRGRAFQFPDMLIVVNSDHQRPHLAAVGIAELQRTCRPRAVETNARCRDRGEDQSSLAKPGIAITSLNSNSSALPASPDAGFLRTPGRASRFLIGACRDGHLIRGQAAKTHRDIATLQQ